MTGEEFRAIRLRLELSQSAMAKVLDRQFCFKRQAVYTDVFSRPVKAEWSEPGGHCLSRHLRPAAIALKVPFRSTTKAPTVSGNTIISYCFATARLKSGSSVRM